MNVGFSDRLATWIGRRFPGQSDPELDQAYENDSGADVDSDSIPAEDYSTASADGSDEAIDNQTEAADSAPEGTGRWVNLDVPNEYVVGEADPDWPDDTYNPYESLGIGN
jgi:hypothetical protein